MADTNIKFKIGTVFSGEGIDAANKAFSENRKEIAASIKGLGELAKNLGSISPVAGEAVAGVSSLIDSFAKFGVIGGSIQVAMTGITKAVELGVAWFDRQKQAVKEYAEAARDFLFKAFDDGKVKVDAMKDSVKELNGQLDAMAKLANLNLSTEMEEKIYKVNVERLQAVTDEMTAATRAVVDAQADQKIAIIKAETAISKSAVAVDAASKAFTNAAEVEKEATAANAKAQAALNIARNDLSISDEDLKKAVDAAAAAQKAQDDAARAVAAAQYNLEAASAANTKANNDLEIVQLETAQKIRDAQDAVEKERAAAEEVAKRAREAEEKKEEEAWKTTESLKRVREGMEEEIANRLGLNESTKKLTEAQKKAAEEISNSSPPKATKDVQKVQVMNKDDINVTTNYEPVNKEIQKPKGLDDKTWERFKNGLANVQDFQKMGRFAEAENRDRANKMKLLEADTQRFIKLVDTPEKWRSEADNKFLEIYRDKVLPQIPKEMAKEMMQNSANHLVLKNDLKEFLGNDSTLMNWLDKVYEKFESATIK